MIEIDDLHKRYGDKTALDGVTFSVKPGEMFGFVGANGAGKTTTMRILMGMLTADSGSVLRDGRPLTFEDRRGFGYMPEERGLYQKMKVTEQIEYFGRLRGMSSGDARRATEDLLSGSRSPSAATTRWTRSPWATSSACSSRSPWCTTPRCSSWTNPSPGWTRSPSTRWPTCSPNGAAPACRCSSPATSWTWWNGSATRSASSPPVVWWPAARSRTCATGRDAAGSGSSSVTRPRLDLRPAGRHHRERRRGPPHRRHRRRPGDPPPRRQGGKGRALRLAAAHAHRDLQRGGGMSSLWLVAQREIVTRGRTKAFVISLAGERRYWSPHSLSSPGSSPGPTPTRWESPGRSRCSRAHPDGEGREITIRQFPDEAAARRRCSRATWTPRWWPTAGSSPTARSTGELGLLLENAHQAAQAQRQLAERASTRPRWPRRCGSPPWNRSRSGRTPAIRACESASRRCWSWCCSSCSSTPPCMSPWEWSRRRGAASSRSC